MQEQIMRSALHKITNTLERENSGGYANRFVMRKLEQLENGWLVVYDRFKDTGKLETRVMYFDDELNDKWSMIAQ